jgi:transposase
VYDDRIAMSSSQWWPLPRGAPPFDPALMVCLLLYAYCVGVCASRKMAQACERHLAFVALGAVNK